MSSDCSKILPGARSAPSGAQRVQRAVPPSARWSLGDGEGPPHARRDAKYGAAQTLRDLGLEATRALIDELEGS